MLLRAAKARALVHGRDHALPDDVQALAHAVLSHRLMLAPEAAGVQRDEIVTDAITAVPALSARCDPRSAARRSGSAPGRRGHLRRRPLYVTGAALLLLGAGALAWIGIGGVGAKLSREIGMRSVVEEQPLHVKLLANRAGCRCRRAGSTSRCCPTPLRLPAGAARRACDRGHVRPPRPAPAPAAALVLRDLFGLAQRVDHRARRPTRSSCCRGSSR